jgi:hypothetical protein
MKMPTSTKPTSGFHICDILELNKEKHQKSREEKAEAVEDKSKSDDKCEEDDVELKVENSSYESDENQNETPIKRKHTPQPSSPSIRRESTIESPQDLKDSRKGKKHSKHADDRTLTDAQSDRHQLLSDTLHQYPQLFQNHPAMRPWFNSNRK